MRVSLIQPLSARRLNRALVMPRERPERLAISRWVRHPDEPSAAIDSMTESSVSRLFIAFLLPLEMGAVSINKAVKRRVAVRG
jgi:hypothetical protein